jgi:hypothetical protein
MLQVTADVFSGRPNPIWIIADDKEARAVLKEIAQNRSLAAEDAPPDAGLGFRGVIVEPLADDLAKDFNVSSHLYIPAGASGALSSKREEIIEWLIRLVPQAVPGPEVADALPLDQPLQQFLTEQLSVGSRQTVSDSRHEGAAVTQPEAREADRGVEAGVEVGPAVTCYYELGVFNPNFWNDAYVRPRNNCYNYASNKRTDTFAQPGRGSGRIYGAISCAEVSAAALRDGCHRRYDCFPDSERPRYLVALVVAPGYDYHWYRYHSGGFWGHKPGGTAARNTDNAGRLITNPETCSRAPYTQFCGYFYTCRSQRIR